MIAPSVQALAELSGRIAVLEHEISLLARTKYPQTLWLQQVPGVGAITALYFVLKIEERSVLKMCARWEPTPAYVRGVIRAERAICNCASPRGEMPICAGCWSVPRNTFWDHLALRARCVNMD